MKGATYEPVFSEFISSFKSKECNLQKPYYDGAYLIEGADGSQLH